MVYGPPSSLSKCPRAFPMLIKVAAEAADTSRSKCKTDRSWHHIGRSFEQASTCQHPYVKDADRGEKKAGGRRA